MESALLDTAGPGICTSTAALVHDYMTQLGGAERVAGHLARAFADASLLTSVHDEAVVPLQYIGGRKWRTSYLQPAAGRVPLKLMLPLLPGAIASLDVRDRELVVSSTSGFAHHVRKATGARHVAFCSTPPRFLWRPDEYFRGNAKQRAGLAPLLSVLRRLDLRAAAGVDAYVAVSKHIAQRVREIYGREATVVHPPVELERFTPSRERSGRFLVVSRLVRSKHVDLVVDTANRYELPLDVIGRGPELARLRRQAGPTVRVHGWLPDAAVRRAMAECTAVVIAGEEDFGLVTAEAQASGRPPVAFASGGALEIIEHGTTGYLFDRHTKDSLGAALQEARDHAFDTADLVTSAMRFSLPAFLEAFRRAVETSSPISGKSPSVKAAST